MNWFKFLYGLLGIGIFAGMVMMSPYEQNIWVIVTMCLVGIVGVTLTVDGAMQKKKPVKERGENK